MIHLLKSHLRILRIHHGLRINAFPDIPGEEFSSKMKLLLDK